MKLTRIISVFEYQLEDFQEGKTYDLIKNESWSGPNSKQSFVNEWDKGIEIVIHFENARDEDFRKLTLDDVNDYDIFDCDIEVYDEYRALKNKTLKIIDFADGREDIGYIEVKIDY